MSESYSRAEASTAKAGRSLALRNRVWVGLRSWTVTDWARVAAISCVVLALGAQIQLPRLWPGTPRISSAHSLLFVSLGFALWLVLPKANRSSFNLRLRAGQILALFIGACSLIVLAHNLLRGGSTSSFWFSPETAAFPVVLSALGLGVGLLLVDLPLRRIWWSDLLALLTLQIALLALIGHCFGVTELYGSLNPKAEPGMTLSASCCVLFLALGLLCARGERGVIQLLRSHTPGATLARRWALTPFGILLMMGTVYLMLQSAPRATHAVVTWTLFMTNLTSLTLAIWATAEVLHRAGLQQDYAQRTLEDRVWQRTSELKQSNAALQAAKEELARANQGLEKTVAQRTLHLQETIRSLETVCYNIAHDLRAPNRAIAGFAQALLEDHAENLDPAARDLLERIAASARRSDTLTVDLLHYGRLGHADLPCSTQSLRPHLEAVMEKLAVDIAESGATIEVSGPLPSVHANPTALEMVLTNLLANALKFVAPGVHPRITIHARDAGPCWRVAVRDNGIGIAPEYFEKIFGVFQRLHSAEEYPGSGIGLAIVQKSLQRMGGKIGLDSTVGAGTCFWFELPKASETGV